jgi:hypothetical protein
VAHQTDPLVGALKSIAPVVVKPVDKANLDLFKYFLSRYHYLGFSGTVGQNMKYMVFDKRGKPLSCLLFGSAAYRYPPGGKLQELQQISGGSRN